MNERGKEIPINPEQPETFESTLVRLDREFSIAEEVSRAAKEIICKTVENHRNNRNIGEYCNEQDRYDDEEEPLKFFYSDHPDLKKTIEEYCPRIENETRKLWKMTGVKYLQVGADLFLQDHVRNIWTWAKGISQIKNSKMGVKQTTNLITEEEVERLMNEGFRRHQQSKQWLSTIDSYEKNYGKKLDEELNGKSEERVTYIGKRLKHNLLMKNSDFL